MDLPWLMGSVFKMMLNIVDPVTRNKFRFADGKAAKRAAADSKFGGFHLKIQKMFASERFQAATAALIILVHQLICIFDAVNHAD